MSGCTAHLSDGSIRLYYEVVLFAAGRQRLLSSVPCQPQMLCRKIAVCDMVAKVVAHKSTPHLNMVLLHAGGITFKPLNSSKKWESLDRDAKDVLESLLHDLPERCLTATQLLHNSWLYAAQGKAFPDEPLFAPVIPPVPLHISHHIQRRQRHTQLLPVTVDPFRAHVDIQAWQPKQHMAGQRAGPHSPGHAGQAQAVAQRLHPYPYPFPFKLASTKSGPAARGPRAPPAASFAAAAPPAASYSFSSAVPKPQPLDLPDTSLYPCSVVPKRPSATNARQTLQGSAAYPNSGTPAHGQVVSADSELLSVPQSNSASESMTSSTSQSNSELLYSASEYSSPATHSSLESLA